MSDSQKVRQSDNQTVRQLNSGTVSWSNSQTVKWQLHTHACGLASRQVDRLKDWQSDNRQSDKQEVIRLARLTQKPTGRQADGQTDQAGCFWYRIWYTGSADNFRDGQVRNPSRSSRFCWFDSDSTGNNFCPKSSHWNGLISKIRDV